MKAETYSTTSIALAVALAMGGSALLWVLFVPSERVFTIDSREVLEYRVRTDGVVEYIYKGEAVPEYIVPDEDPALRTESSYTRKLTDGTLLARVYSGKAYAVGTDAWHYRETATTTQEELAKAAHANPLAFLMVKRVYAADIYSGAGDGEVMNSGSGFSSTRDSSTGDNFNSGGTTARVLSQKNSSGTTATIYRALFPFDTSSIPANAVIDSATFTIFWTTKDDDDNDGRDYITVIQTTQPSHTSLTTSDYNDTGGTSPVEGIDSGQRKDLSAGGIVNPAVFTLNSTGLSWIKKFGEASSCGATTGLTCLGIREGHDMENNNPGNSTITGITLSTSETSGTSNDPYLSITYTAPVTIATDAASSLSHSSATLNATISDTGGDAADTCGFAWGTNSALSGGDTATTSDSTCPATTGSFTKDLTSLVASTAYYFRAYGTNSVGTGYGAIETFTTGDPLPPEMRLKGGVRLQGSRLLGL